MKEIKNILSYLIVFLLVISCEDEPLYSTNFTNKWYKSSRLYNFYVKFDDNGKYIKEYTIYLSQHDSVNITVKGDYELEYIKNSGYKSDLYLIDTLDQSFYDSNANEYFSAYFDELSDSIYQTLINPTMIPLPDYLKEDYFQVTFNDRFTVNDTIFGNVSSISSVLYANGYIINDSDNLNNISVNRRWRTAGDYTDIPRVVNVNYDLSAYNLIPAVWKVYQISEDTLTIIINSEFDRFIYDKKR